MIYLSDEYVKETEEDKAFDEATSLGFLDCVIDEVTGEEYSLDEFSDELTTN